MELFLGEVSASADCEDREHGLDRVVIEEVRLMIVIVLKVDLTLERHSRIGLNTKRSTSTKINVSSH